MKKLSQIKGLKTLSKAQQGKINGNGPDLCYEYWTFGTGTVYCCGTVCTQPRSGQWDNVQ